MLPPSADGTVTFKTTTQLVIETVGVKDKSGKPIEGLTAKDFIVTEDGVPQTISFFEYQKLPEAPAAAILQPHAALVAAPLPKLPRTQIAPETPGDVRYRDQRLLALYFDMTAMPIPDQLRALDGGAKVHPDADDAGRSDGHHDVFDSGAVQVLQDFTDDRDRLLSIIETMVVGEDENVTATDDSSADTGAAFGQNDAEFNIFFTDRQLSALQTAANMLGKLNEKKVADLLRQRTAAERRRQSGAAARDHQCGDPRGSLVLADRRARSGGAGAAGRCEQGIAGRAGDVYRRVRHGRDDQHPAVAGHAVGAGRRHRRQGAAGFQRPVHGHRAGAEGVFELLHHRLLHHQCESGRQIPPHQDFAARGRLAATSITGRATTPARSSANSRLPIKNGSSKMR